MAVLYDIPPRGFPHQNTASGLGLDDKFDIIKEIGDGSFGSVALARVRTAGATIARRGTMVGHTISIHYCNYLSILGCGKNYEKDF
jgi:meiosis induction protein kinase IME2/SME1